MGQICYIETINDKHAENTILFIGIRDETKIEGFNFQYFGGLLLSYFENLKYKKISIYVGNVKKVKPSYDNMVLNFASGICLKSYSFNKPSTICSNLQEFNIFDCIALYFFLSPSNVSVLILL